MCDMYRQENSSGVWVHHRDRVAQPGRGWGGKTYGKGHGGETPAEFFEN